ncbi:hypothetical protein SAMN04487881_0075 [Marinobacter sp. es.048]|uniref:hypothetical protein n=1 Tax=Marinobacter sp. es.048 TaxID=1761795 RepID=UPI000B598316|nr:hypothetical protein [Marinobacter sp. es.048]SNC59533.1 hypothetical protein SAMN04487881_0075 [Marinobacter sp. es.048]
MSNRATSLVESRVFEIAWSYFRGLVILSASGLLAAFILSALTSFLKTSFGVDLAQQAQWFVAPTFQVVATAIACVYSSVAVKKMLGKEAQFLWGWPAVVACFSLILTAFMGSDWAFAEDAQRTGAVVLAAVVAIRLRDEK